MPMPGTSTFQLPEPLRRLAEDQPCPLLFATISGAHLYGFPTAESDWELRGVHVLPLREVVGLSEPRETLERAAAVDGVEANLVTHDIHKFCRLLLTRNGYVLEQLFSPHVVQTTPEHEELKHLAHRCITRFHAHHYLGFSRNQWHLFVKENPPRIKPLLYIYRVLLTGIHLMETGEVEANLTSLNEKFRLTHLPELIERKMAGGDKAVLDDAEVAFHREELDRLTAELEAAREVSSLPLEPLARREINDLLIRVRLGTGNR